MKGVIKQRVKASVGGTKINNDEPCRTTRRDSVSACHISIYFMHQRKIAVIQAPIELSINFFLVDLNSLIDCSIFRNSSF